MKTLFIVFLITVMMVGFCVLVWGIITLKDYYSKNHINFSDIWESLIDSGIIVFTGCCIAGGIGLFMLSGISNDKDNELAELDKKAYSVCKVYTPTKVYQTATNNFVVMNGKVYNVTDKAFGLYTVGEKCK
jgi:hypothetical protein